MVLFQKYEVFYYKIGHWLTFCNEKNEYKYYT